jgi:hypothetical protein
MRAGILGRFEFEPAVGELLRIAVRQADGPRGIERVGVEARLVRQGDRLGQRRLDEKDRRGDRRQGNFHNSSSRRDLANTAATAAPGRALRPVNFP